MSANSIDRSELARAVPDSSGALRLPGLDTHVEIWRDPEGIPHIRASSIHDMFFAQGFVHAQDRLWQMEYDRRRAKGRWAECTGPADLANDALMRRFGLEASARSDVDAADAETRSMLEAYAEGVNAYVRISPRLPIEFRLAGVEPEAWLPQDSAGVYKVRHAQMGVWQAKAWRARLLRHLGPELTARLCPGEDPNPMLIVPPGVEYRGPVTDGLAALVSGYGAAPALPEWELGSNNWAVSGARTASGKPLIAGDPHRALEAPNVYYQNHIACPEIDAIGLSFPGVPGLPHFGHNASVAWCVTHTCADYQDLYIERFAPGRPLRYEHRGRLVDAEFSSESIRARDGAELRIEIVRTMHGPIVLGDPASGFGLALRYTATAAPNHTFEALLPMLRARSADELEESQRCWVDPVNNFVFADVHGSIRYRTRGQVPVRAGANAWLPVPGWDAEHEWRGMVAFEDMPVLRDPAAGWLATANARVTGAGYPHYLGMDWSPDFRTRRLVERLSRLDGATLADMEAIHADRVSIPARVLLEALRDCAPGPSSTSAYERLLAWDGVMDKDSVAATIYAALRERLVRNLLTPILGKLSVEALSGLPGGGSAFAARIRARLGDLILRGDTTLLPLGSSWPAAISRALEEAVAELEAKLGTGQDAWRWGRVHMTRPRHTLSVSRPELAALLDPPSLPVGGDSDTVMSTGFSPAAGYGVATASVARYVFDLADWDRSGWVVPLGSSGHPGSRHYADQAAVWSECRLLPMRYSWDRVRAEAESRQVLEP